MEKELTKAGLAKELGVSRAYISMLTSGKRKPSKKIINKLDTLGVTLNQPVGGSSPLRLTSYLLANFSAPQE